jgi:cytochrome b pre-mRNA-processing protein 3
MHFGMFARLFGRGRRANRAITDLLYEEIVAAARQPAFYSDFEVPDTPMGRYEMLSLHVFLLLHRLRGEEGAAREVAQDLTDEYFRDVEHSLRELGIGDQGIPRRMKKLGRMFYGRAAAYGAALDAGDRDSLVAALARNVRPDLASWPQAARLADHVLAAWADIAGRPVDDAVTGRLRFLRQPAAEGMA